MTTACRVQMSPDGTATVSNPGDITMKPSDNWKDPNVPVAHVGSGFRHRVTFGGGQVSTENLGPRRTTVIYRNPNTVTVGGMETTRKAAMAAGLSIDGESEYPARSWRSVPDHAGDFAAGRGATRQDHSPGNDPRLIEEQDKATKTERPRCPVRPPADGGHQGSS